MENPDEQPFDVPCAISTVGSSARGIKSLLSRLRKAPNLDTKYAKFTNVPPDVAKQHLAKGCQQMYSQETRILIVTIPSRPHEVVAGTIHEELTLVAHSVNLGRHFLSLGSARVEGNSSSKEPDGSWIPDTLPSTRNDTWPTVVLEVGVSETMNKLRADAAWWLSNSRGLVQVVITVSVNRHAPQITFESIVLVKPLPVLRNGRPRYQATTRQSITVSRPPGGQNQPITTTPNTPLMISCEELLCRPPTPPESDPNIPVASLERIASLAWRFQGL